MVSKIKKSTHKLAIRREALRVLAELNLARVAGGNPDAALQGTGGPNTSCPNALLAQPVKP
jgi:hypothetical protein